jgi:hypothetical protein
MHDCPRCKVPLHGHEEFCPSCGTKQVVRKEFSDIRVPEAPPINLVPFIVAFVILLGVGFLAAQSTWIGQLMTHGAPKEDPMDKLTMPQARQMIEQGLTQGLQQVGAPVKITYTADEKPATAAVAMPVKMTVETTLKDPTTHKAIVDAIKPYMEKAEIPVLEMHDTKSRATWTYNVQLGAAKPADSDPFAPAPPPGAAPGAAAAPAAEQPAQQ